MEDVKTKIVTEKQSISLLFKYFLPIYQVPHSDCIILNTHFSILKIMIFSSPGNRCRQISFAVIGVCGIREQLLENFFYSKRSLASLSESVGMLVPELKWKVGVRCILNAGLTASMEPQTVSNPAFRVYSKCKHSTKDYDTLL